jgi:hypothetical protein
VSHLEGSKRLKVVTRQKRGREEVIGTGGERNIETLADT